MIFSYHNSDSQDRIYQWDSDLYLDAEVADIADEDGTIYAHFQHSQSEDILSLEIEDGKVAIPNILLQTDGAFRVFCYVNDESYGKTLVEDMFTIIPRPMPPEYIYDPTPVITYPELVELVAKLTNVSASAESILSGQATASVEETATGLAFSFGIPVFDNNVIIEYDDLTPEGLREVIDAGKIPVIHQTVESHALPYSLHEFWLLYLGCSHTAPNYAYFVDLANRNGLSIYYMSGSNIGTWEYKYYLLRSQIINTVRQSDYPPSGTAVMNYVADCKTVKVWENPDPSATFASQDIVVSRLNEAVLNRELFLIEFRQLNTGSLCVTGIMPRETEGYIYAPTDAVNTNNKKRARKVKVYRDSNTLVIEFGAGYADGSTASSSMIPTRVWAI